MNYSLFDTCIVLLHDYDKDWMKRKRMLDTEIIYKSLISSAITNVGVSSCLKGFECNFSHVALNKARNKLGEHCFKNINMEINKSFNDCIGSVINIDQKGIYILLGNPIIILNMEANVVFNSMLR